MKNKEIQKELERQNNKNLLWKRIYNEIKSDSRLMELIENTSIPKLALKALAFIAIYKRLEISTLVAMLYKPETNLTETVTLVEELYNKKLINFDPDRNQFMVRFELESEVEDEINSYQYPLPLIIKPKLIKHNFGSAYYLKDKQSILLNKHKTKNDVDLEHINLMNQVAFSINESVLAKAINKWHSTSKDSQRQIERFNKYCGISQKLLLENGNKFYFSHRYDYRGRCYCEGYYLNYQGNDYCKSILEFNHKELID